MDKLEVLRGSVRPVVTYAFAGAFIAGLFTGHVPKDAFLSVAGMVMAFWFQSRTEEKKNGTPLPEDKKVVQP